MKALNCWQEDESVAVAAREFGPLEQNLYNGKSKHVDVGLEVSDLAELKRLREENTGLKKLLADQSLDITILKNFNSRKW